MMTKNSAIPRVSNEIRAQIDPGLLILATIYLGFEFSLSQSDGHLGFSDPGRFLRDSFFNCDTNPEQDLVTSAVWQ